MFQVLKKTWDNGEEVVYEPAGWDKHIDPIGAAGSTVVLLRSKGRRRARITWRVVEQLSPRPVAVLCQQVIAEDGIRGPAEPDSSGQNGLSMWVMMAILGINMMISMV